jgi:hypothetical protein
MLSIERGLRESDRMMIAQTYFAAFECKLTPFFVVSALAVPLLAQYLDCASAIASRNVTPLLVPACSCGKR